MAFAFVSGTGKKLVNSAANPAVVSGLTASVAGEFVVCEWTSNGASVNITGATSNVGGTWVIVQGSLSAGNNRSGFAYCLSAPAGITQVSLTGSAGSPFITACVNRFSYSGTASLDTGSSPAGGFIGSVAGAVSTTVPINSGNLTPSQTSALLLFAYGSDDSSAGTVTIGGSGTYVSSFNEGDTTVNHAGAGGYQIVSTAGPFNVTGLYNQENARGAIILAAFIDSGGGGGAVDNPRSFDNGVPGAYYTDPGFSALYGYEQQGIPLANRDSQTNTTLTGAFSSAGVATPVGVGASIVAAAASSAGVSSVIGVGASTAAADITSIMLATVTGVPNAISAATITAAAVATLIGVGQNAGSIVSGDGSIIGTSSMIGVGVSTAAGVVTAAGTETTTGVGASTVAGVISETAVGQALGAGASSGGNIIISADGSISASASANGTGASTVAADIHASAVATMRGATTNPSRVVHGGQVRRALMHQRLMLERDEADLLELAAMLVPMLSQGGALWHR